MADTTQLVLIELGRMAQVLEDRVESPDEFVTWMEELGWSISPPAASGLGAVTSAVAILVDLLEEAESGDLAEMDDDTLQQLAAQALACIVAAKDLPALFTGITVPADFFDTAPQQIAESLFMGYLDVGHPLVYSIFRLAGVVTIEHRPAAGDRPEHDVEIFSFDALGQFFTDPATAFQTLHGWGTPEADLLGLIEAFQSLAHALGIPAFRQTPRDEIVDDLYTGLPDDIDEDALEMRIPLLEIADQDVGFAEAGLAVLPLFDAAWGSEGLALVPYADGGLDIEVPLGEYFVLRLGAGIAGSIRIEVRYDSARVVVREDGSDFSGSGSMEVALKENAGEPTIIAGQRDASRLEVRGLSASLDVGVIGGQADATIQFSLQDGKLFVSFAEGDGFLKNIFGDLTLESDLDLGIGWSTLDGMFFHGSAGLEVTIPIHVELGPILLESIFVGLVFEMDEGVLELRAGLTAGLELGPLAASITRAGISAKISQSDDGNLGLLDIARPGFLAPTGAGFAMDSGVTGGGFLDFDDTNKRYAGMLALEIGEIGLVAIGLITTRMPDGSDGFSMLVSISVTFDPPIELTMAFTLSGVGGLFGINRTMSTEALQRGIKNRTLDGILFPDPRTVIANANKIISDMGAVFPVAEGQFVFGPMIQFGWGQPENVIIANIGIFIEIGISGSGIELSRVVLMGQVKAEFPTPKDPLIRINLDVLGVLDLEKEELSFQASLYDSGILEFEIYGDSAFFLSWGRRPEFAMSMGGFHPKFTPPPPPLIFADLRRLTISISSGSDLQLSCSSYMALTPNSLQFGARVELYASAAGAVVEGHLTFDALFYFSPFSFEVPMSASVHISFEGINLADIRLELSLAGPTPWNARGLAIFKVLFFDIEASFDITWGSDDAATAPLIDPWAQFKAALESADAWGGFMPSRWTMAESLAPVPEEDEEATRQLVVHPAGAIEVLQNILPLNTALEKFGNATIDGHDRFEIAGITVGDDGDTSTAARFLTDFFARGQFERLSSAQKLSVPSFEKMDAGITTVMSGALRIGTTEAVNVEHCVFEYESAIIDDDGALSQAPVPGAIPSRVAPVLIKGSTAMRLRRAIRARELFSRAAVASLPSGIPGLIGATAGPTADDPAAVPVATAGAKQDGYRVVHASDLTTATLDARVGVANQGLTKVAADQALKGHLRFDPTRRLLVVPEYEAADHEEAA